jgi:hypothetical protein
VGARLSDVFAADRVLWVEGKTEALCFPRIVTKLLKRHLARTAIVEVVETGNFESKDAPRVAEIYRRLASAAQLVPPAIGFVFDREYRSEQKRSELNTACQGLAVFLPRYCYENYLLHAGAIAAVLGRPEADVERWLADHAADDQFFRGAEVLGYDTRPRRIIRDARGSLILEELFWELSGQTVEYQKVKHGPQLTDWLIEHAPEALTELGDLLAPHFPG